MKYIYKIELSSQEILILSALLGYKSVFGVKEKIFSNSYIDMKSLIRQQVRRLERKKLIRYELDGTLYIIPGLRKVIDCICGAETVGIFSTNLKSGKRASVYVLEKESEVTMLEQICDGKFSIHLTEFICLKEIIPYEILSSQYSELKESMLFEEAEYVHKQIETFNHDNAEKRIKKHIKSDSAIKLVAKILTGNCGYMSVKVYRKETAIYNAIYNALLMAVDNYTISINSDENDVIYFETLSPINVVEQINSQFKLGKKRGTV